MSTSYPRIIIPSRTSRQKHVGGGFPGSSMAGRMPSCLHVMMPLQSNLPQEREVSRLAANDEKQGQKNPSEVRTSVTSVAPKRCGCWPVVLACTTSRACLRCPAGRFDRIRSDQAQTWEWLTWGSIYASQPKREASEPERIEGVDGCQSHSRVLASAQRTPLPPVIEGCKCQRCRMRVFASSRRNEGCGEGPCSFPNPGSPGNARATKIGAGHKGMAPLIPDSPMSFPIAS